MSKGNRRLSYYTLRRDGALDGNDQRTPPGDSCQRGLRNTGHGLLLLQNFLRCFGSWEATGTGNAEAEFLIPMPVSDQDSNYRKKIRKDLLMKSIRPKPEKIVGFLIM